MSKRPNPTFLKKAEGIHEFRRKRTLIIIACVAAVALVTTFIMSVAAMQRKYSEAYPELVSQQQLVERVIREEEEAFLRTLDKGIKLMDSMMEKSRGTKVIAGTDAFTLYDTFGFPIDLTELIAGENGFKVDMDGFNVELNKQKERARNATAVENGDWVEINPFTAMAVGFLGLPGAALVVALQLLM